jgi:hypothetical protein
MHALWPFSESGVHNEKVTHITKDCHYKKFVYLITFLFILKSSQPYSLINHITDSVVYFSNKYGSILDKTVCNLKLLNLMMTS